MFMMISKLFLTPQQHEHGSHFNCHALFCDLDHAVNQKSQRQTNQNIYGDVQKTFQYSEYSDTSAFYPHTHSAPPSLFANCSSRALRPLILTASRQSQFLA